MEVQGNKNERRVRCGGKMKIDDGKKTGERKDLPTEEQDGTRKEGRRE